METNQQEFPQEIISAPSMVKDVPYDERLNTWEISQLWLIYQADCALKCILQYFVSKTQDPEIKSMFNDALNRITQQQSTLIDLFNSVQFPIPHGFTDEDVEPNAKRLYSDSLMLTYCRSLIRFRLVKLAHSLSIATRPDVREFFNNAVVQEQNFLNQGEDLLTQKGIHAIPPYSPVPDRVNNISNFSWYGNLFGGGRPLNILEYTHVFKRLETKLIENAIHLGFTQVVKDAKIKALFIRGLKIFDKEFDKWSKIIKKEDLLLPMTWKSEVTDSTESPFSDKLMLFQLLLNISYSVYANGFALANCNRRDLVAAFTKTEIDLANYGKDGLDLMIENGWMEEIPLVVDREEMIGLKH
jgi:hypothetical protein